MSEYADNTPLFGEESKGAKVFTWLGIIIIGIWAAYCIALGIAFGILQNVANILLAATLILGCAALILLWKWWRQEDLDPKFRILLFLLVIQVMLAGATINVYVWNVHTVPPTPAEACIYNDPYMQKPIFAAAFGGMCVSDCSVTYGPNYGHDWTKTGAPCRQFIITNNTVVQDRATGHAEAQKRVLDEVKKREIVDAEGKKKVWNPFLKKYVEVAQK